MRVDYYMCPKCYEILEINPNSDTQPNLICPKCNTITEYWMSSEIDATDSVVANYDGNKVISIACPYCKSMSTTKITNSSKAVHTFFFGLFSNPRNSKQWHCNSCKSDF